MELDRVLKKGNLVYSGKSRDIYRIPDVRKIIGQNRLTTAELEKVFLQ